MGIEDRTNIQDQTVGSSVRVSVKEGLHNFLVCVNAASLA